MTVSPDRRLVEDAARAFHEAYERLAPDFGYETRPESAVAWEDVPEANRRLMMATVAVVVPVVERDVRERISKQIRAMPDSDLTGSGDGTYPGVVQIGEVLGQAA